LRDRSGAHNKQRDSTARVGNAVTSVVGPSLQIFALAPNVDFRGTPDIVRS